MISQVAILIFKSQNFIRSYLLERNNIKLNVLFSRNYHIKQQNAKGVSDAFISAKFTSKHSDTFNKGRSLLIAIFLPWIGFPYMTQVN